MSKLTEFLIKNNDVTNITEEVFISNRFKDEKGKKLPFTIRAMTGDEFGTYQKACTTPAKGKDGKPNFDATKFNAMVIENHCIEPDFKSAEFCKSVGVPTPQAAIQRVLLAGEIVELGTQITKLSGFDTDINDEIEEAKN